MHRLRPCIFAAAAALAMAVLYLAFTDNLCWRELIAAVLVGAVSATAAMVFARARQIRFAFRMRDIAQAWRILWNVLIGTIEVLQGLGKQLFFPGGANSAILAVRFEMGEQDSPTDAGRRALAITYTTATPNFIVLGLVNRQGLMLYHQIVPGGVRPMTRNLGARP